MQNEYLIERAKNKGAKCSKTFQGNHFIFYSFYHLLTRGKTNKKGYKIIIPIIFSKIRCIESIEEF